MRLLAVVAALVSASTALPAFAADYAKSTERQHPGLRDLASPRLHVSHLRTHQHVAARHEYRPVVSRFEPLLAPWEWDPYLPRGVVYNVPPPPYAVGRGGYAYGETVIRARY